MFRVTLATVLGLLVACAAQCADKPADQFTKGSVWKGEGEFTDGKVDDRGLRVTDVVVKFTERKDGTLKGELWVDKNTRGFAFDGSVTDGAVEFVFTKPLKGDWAKHWTGRKGTVTTVKDLLSCEFVGSRKAESPTDKEHFKARLQAR